MSATRAALHEPWASLERERLAASFGLWVFLATEVLFFGGIFLGFSVYRVEHPETFRFAASHAAVLYGTANTAILLTSSLFVAVAVEAAKAGLRRLALRCLAATILFGVAFLVVKTFEYLKDIHEGLVPGHGFRLEPASTQLFWGLYWIATSVHALHVAIGIGLMAVLWLRTALRRLPLRASPIPEVTALYWHFVDVVWIFLYPIIYLVGRT